MIPGKTDPTWHKVYPIEGEEWDALSNPLDLLLETWSKANVYALQLSIDAASGRAPNWVTMTFIWF